jgi:hypothetical protein
MMLTPRAFAAVLLAALVLAARPPAANADGAPATRRLAVVVGANAAAPGRKPLRFAHRDARAVAEVLRDLGGFASADVSLLLDPHPDAVLGALDDALRDAAAAKVETLVFFYYSGHADTASLYPAGHALSLEKLRARLEDGRAAMRIGIIDACRGGGWTGSKGLSASQTFAIEQALDLSTQGSVLIASSSGMEDAHESVALRGSFFTHHWNAAMRGAADRNGDDKVTLNEAFEYARTLTIRDTALHTENPQHPSFRFNLRGRGDPQLAELSPGRSVIELAQDKGPLQVIHLGTGLLVVELPAGARRVRVSLPPGRYMVRRREHGSVLAREVRLGTGQRVSVLESSLSAVRVAGLDAKGGEALAVEGSHERESPAPLAEIQLSMVTNSWDGQWAEIDGTFVGNQYVGVQGSYMLRHGRHLATRLGVGFLRPDRPGEGGMLLSVGESLAWPLFEMDEPVRGVSSSTGELYLSGQLGLRGAFEDTAWADPYQLQGNAAVGFRIYTFFAQVGYGSDLFGGIRLNLATELGLRLTRDFL